MKSFFKSGKRFNTLFLSLAIAAAIGGALLMRSDAQESAAGSSAADPLVISTPAEMISYFNDIKTKSGDIHGKLSSDIALTAEESAQISSSDAVEFSATFDGAGHKISGFVMNGGSNAGLFSIISGDNAEVKDLTVEGTVKQTGGSNGGGIAGNIVSGTVSNCRFAGSVEGTGFSMGGIAGNVEANGNISGCTVSADKITSENDTSYSGGQDVGGIAGSSSGTIENCTAEFTEIWATFTNIGGICGSSSGVVKNSTAKGQNLYNMQAAGGGSNPKVGGVCGYNYVTSDADAKFHRASIISCNADIESITASGNNGAAGGICGTCFGDPLGNAVILNSSAKFGTITAENASSAGGIAGYISREVTIEGCFAEGDKILGGTNSIVGGLAGSLNSDIKNSAAKINAIAGGFCGQMVGNTTKSTNAGIDYYGTVTNCGWQDNGLGLEVIEINDTSISPTAVSYDASEASEISVGCTASDSLTMKAGESSDIVFTSFPNGKTVSVTALSADVSPSSVASASITSTGVIVAGLSEGSAVANCTYKAPVTNFSDITGAKIEGSAASFATNLTVTAADPETTPGSDDTPETSGGSSGGCSAGFGSIYALLAAALVIRRRK